MAINTILHVEDDPNDVMLMGMAFRKAGLNSRLSVVDNGDDAISYLSGEGIYEDRVGHPFPTLMLLDIKLPRKSGLEVLAWVRSHSDAQIRRVPIIMLTSSNQPNDIGKAYDLGANSYLVKPGDLAVLVELVKSIHHYWLNLNVLPTLDEPRHSSSNQRKTSTFQGAST